MPVASPVAPDAADQEAPDVQDASSAPQSAQPTPVPSTSIPDSSMPPAWQDVQASPQYRSLTPQAAAQVFKNWVSETQGFLTAKGATKEQQASFSAGINDVAAKNFGLGIPLDDTGKPLTLGALGAMVKGPGQTVMQNQYDRPDLPYTVPKEANGLDAAAAYLSGLSHIVTAPLAPVAKIYDTLTNTKVGGTGLDQMLDKIGQFQRNTDAANPGGTAGTLAYSIPEGAGNLEATVIAGRALGPIKGIGQLGGMAAFAGTDAAEETYHNAINDGASPVQAAESSGVAAAVNAGEMLVLGKAGEGIANKVLGENAAAFLKGAYRPTVAEATKMMAADSATQYGLGAAGQVTQNVADNHIFNGDPNIYGSDAPVLQGANQAGIQQAFFSLAHLPTLLQAFRAKAPEIQAAAQDVVTAKMALDDSVKALPAPTVTPSSEATDTTTDIPDQSYDVNKTLADQMATRLSDASLNKVATQLAPARIQAAVTSVQETARDAAASPDLTLEQKQQAIQSANDYVSRVNDHLGSQQYFPLDADKVITGIHAETPGDLNSFYADHHPAVADVSDGLDAYDKLTQETAAPVSSPMDPNAAPAVRQGEVAPAPSTTPRTIPRVLATRYELAKRRYAIILKDTAKEAAPPTIGDVNDAKDIVSGDKPIPGTNPLDDFNDGLEKELGTDPEAPTTQPEEPANESPEAAPVAETPEAKAPVESGDAAEPASSEAPESAPSVAGEPAGEAVEKEPWEDEDPAALDRLAAKLGEDKGSGIHGTAPAEYLGDEETEPGVKTPRYRMTKDAGPFKEGDTPFGHELVAHGYDLPDTPEQAALRSRITKALGEDAPKSKIVFSTEHQHPAWADPSQPGKIFVNPDVLGKTMADADAGFGDTTHGDEYLRRLMAQKSGEEVIHNAQHRIRGEVDHEAIYDEASPEEQEATRQQYAPGEDEVSQASRDSLDPSKAKTPEEAAQRKVNWVEEHARQILQRKALGETTEDTFKNAKKPGLVRYFQALYQKIKAHVAQFGASPELSKYLKNIESVLEDAKKSGQEIPELKDAGVSGASVPSFGRGQPNERTDPRAEQEAEGRARAGDPRAGADLLRRSLGADSEALGDYRTRGEQAKAYIDLATRLGKVLSPDFLKAWKREFIGGEHEIYIRDGRAYKVTKNTPEDDYGTGIEQNYERTPYQYLNRLALSNSELGDDSKWEGVIPQDGHLRTVTSQTFLKGERPAPAEVRGKLNDLGFKRMQGGDSMAPEDEVWHRPSDNVLLGDVKPANWIKTPDGNIHPIDVIAENATEAQRAKYGLERAPDNDSDMSAASKPNLTKLLDDAKALASGVKGQLFGMRKFSDLPKAVNLFNAMEQLKTQTVDQTIKAFQKDIPNPIRRSAISHYIEAAGDKALLKTWQDTVDASAKSPADEIYSKQLEAAQNLTPKELAWADRIKKSYALVRQALTRWGLNIGEVENYVTHLWKRDSKGEAIKGLMGRSLKTSFRFGGGRSIATFFDGWRMGMEPETTDAGVVLGHYINEGLGAVNARKFVANVAKSSMPNGDPAISPDQSGKWVDVESPKGKARLITKPFSWGQYSHYRSLDLPAFTNWYSEGQIDGRRIMLKGDIFVHPEAYEQLNHMFAHSKLREWWNEPTSSPIKQVGQRVVKGVFDDSRKWIKGTLLGGFPLFHMAQEATGAFGYGVNPIREAIRSPVDLNDPHYFDMASHGLQLYSDAVSARNYMEGFSANNSVLLEALKNIPGIREAGGKYIAQLAKDSTDWTFKQLIPRLKAATYENILGRNMKRFAPELQSGKLTLDDVKYRSAYDANNAYGHLNYMDLHRNPTFQHMMSIFALAPDFWEARLRHVGSALGGAPLIGSKANREQFRSFAILGGGLYVASRLINQYLNGDPHWEPENAFRIVNGGRSYQMRSYISDFQEMLANTRTYFTGRLNPVARFMEEGATGVNYRGEKVAGSDILRDLLAEAVPIPLQSMTRGLSATGVNSPVSPIEQLMGSVGIKVSRFAPAQQIFPLAQAWKEKAGIPEDRGVYPTSQYTPLKYALEDGDYQEAAKQYQTVLADHKGNGAKVVKGLFASINAPFTGSKSNDMKFYQDLSDHDKLIYKAAVDRRKLLIQRFQQMRSYAAGN